MRSLCFLLALAAFTPGCPTSEGKKSDDKRTEDNAKKSAEKGVPLRNGAGKLTKAGVDAVWKEIFQGAAQASEPLEKKKTAFETKLGKPAQGDKDTPYWPAVDGEDCYKIELGTDGTLSAEKVFGADKIAQICK
jgi:hypothetical protein